MTRARYDLSRSRSLSLRRIQMRRAPPRVRPAEVTRALAPAGSAVECDLDCAHGTVVSETHDMLVPGGAFIRYAGQTRRS